MSAPSAVAQPRPTRRIQPTRGLAWIDVSEIWRYRELLYLLLWRDIKARYKQTFLGAFWAIFRPFISMVLFTVIFGHLAHIKTGSSIPYPLFVFTGVLVWTYFSSTVTSGASSIAGNASILGKIYFPRLYAPLAAVVAPLVDFALSFVIMIGLFAWYSRLPSWHIVFLPAVLLLALAIGLGISLWLASASIRYRDLQFALPFAVQIWLYITPIIYPVSLVPPSYRWLIDLNPATAVAEGARWSLLGGSPPAGWALVASIGMAALLLVSGILYFRRAERTFVDVM